MINDNETVVEELLWEDDLSLTHSLTVLLTASCYYSNSFTDLLLNVVGL